VKAPRGLSVEGFADPTHPQIPVQRPYAFREHLRDVLAFLAEPAVGPHQERAVRPVPETTTATCSPRWASCWARRPKPATRPPIKIEQRRVVAEPRIQNLGGHRNSDRIRCYSEVIAVSHQRIRARFQQIDREEKGPTRNPPAPLIRHPRSSRCGADARQATRPSAGHADPGTFG